MKKLILFDADGTLIDSQVIIHESMRLTFKNFNYQEPHISATKSIIGLTLDRAIAEILGRDIDDEILAMTQEYKDIYIQIAPRPDMQSAAFTGIPELIATLGQQDDYTLGIVTGKSRRGVTKLLASNDFGASFTVSRCADDCPSKPHPAMVLECCKETGILPKDTIVIGDTSFDMEMATSAGATAVGVAWGYHPTEKLSSSGASSVVNTSEELYGSIKKWATASPKKCFSASPMLLAGALLGPHYA